MRFFKHALALVLLTATLSSHAGFVVTTLQAFFPLIEAGYYDEAFSGPKGTQPSYSFSGGGFSYVVSAPSMGQGDETYLSGGGLIGNFYPNQPLIITFTSGNVTAIGGLFFNTDAFDVFVASSVTVRLDDGTSTTFTPSTQSQADAFRGFFASVSISSLEISAPGNSLYNSIDSLIVGKFRFATPVPELPSWLLMGAGVIGLWFRRASRVTGGPVSRK